MCSILSIEKVNGWGFTAPTNKGELKRYNADVRVKLQAMAVYTPYSNVLRRLQHDLQWCTVQAGACRFRVYTISSERCYSGGVVPSSCPKLFAEKSFPYKWTKAAFYDGVLHSEQSSPLWCSRTRLSWTATLRVEKVYFKHRNDSKLWTTLSDASRYVKQMESI